MTTIFRYDFFWFVCSSSTSTSIRYLSCDLDLHVRTSSRERRILRMTQILEHCCSRHTPSQPTFTTFSLLSSQGIMSCDQFLSFCTASRRVHFPHPDDDLAFEATGPHWSWYRSCLISSASRVQDFHLLIDLGTIYNVLGSANVFQSGEVSP